MYWRSKALLITKNALIKYFVGDLISWFGQEVPNGSIIIIYLSHKCFMRHEISWMPTLINLKVTIIYTKRFVIVTTK